MTSDLPDLHRIQLAFAAHLRNPDQSPRPDDVPEQRAAVYRELFFANIRGALSRAFPVARELLGDERWEQLVRQFWAAGESHAPEFPRVPGEFLAWLQAAPTMLAALPDYFLELLVWEHAELEVMLAPDDEDVKPGDLMTGCPRVTASARVYAFRYPVQKISIDYQPEAPLEQPIFLGCFRNAALDVEFVSLTPASAWLLEHIQSHDEHTGRGHAQCLAAALEADPAAVERDVTQLLTDFLMRGLLIGVWPADVARGVD